MPETTAQRAARLSAWLAARSSRKGGAREDREAAALLSILAERNAFLERCRLRAGSPREIARG